MPLRNIWSLEPGEVITAEEILKNIPNCEVYFPLRDIGIDLLVVRGEKHIAIQVKESRYFERMWRGTRGHSWHQVHEKKFIRDKGRVDFYVFLTYYPEVDKHGRSHFVNRFVIVPMAELEKRMMYKNPGKRRIYSFYFHFGDEVFDKRDKIPDREARTYTDYVDNWDLINQTLKP